MRRGLRARGERGTVLIEFAVVFPILMLLFLALVDFALAELSDSAGSNAAREGGRVGILYFDGAAGTTGSTNANYLKISAAVSEKLAGNVKATPTVTVRCLNPDGTPRPSSGSCSTVSGDAIEAGRDFIEVSVTWNRKGGITGFVGTGFRTDKAVMRIVGTPPTGSAGPPPTCTISSSSATPPSVIHSGGEIPGITFQVRVSAVANCGNPLLAFPPEAGYLGAQTMLLVSGNTFEFPMPAGQGSWTAGTKTVTATANGGSTTQAITFTVVDPIVCLITATSASPNTVTQTSGTLSSPIVFTVTVSSLAACGTPTLTFPGAAGYASPQPMSPAGGNDFSFTLPTTQGSWPSLTYTVTANANDGATGSASFIVSDAPVCTLSHLLPDPTTTATIVLKPTGSSGTNGQVKTDITFRILRSAPCGVPTIQITPGLSGSGSGDLTAPRAMTCIGSTCDYTIVNGSPGWDLSTPRTVTISDASTGTTITRPANVIRG